MLTEDKEASSAPANDRPTPTPETDSSTQEAAREIDEAAHRKRVERLLEEIRGALDASARDRGYKEFSPTRLIGALLQALVVGLLAWALSDWIFQLPSEALFIKLAFAMVLQLTALTALLMSKSNG